MGRLIVAGGIIGGGLASSGAAAPSISYAGSPFAWFQDVAITSASPSNAGGPITSYAVQAGSLPAGVSLNTSTGALTGTPTTAEASNTFTIRATGAGGTSDVVVTYDVFGLGLLSPDAWFDTYSLARLWTDAGRTVNVAAHNDLVRVADDRSGNGRHFTAPSDGLRARCAFDILNGKPALRFLGDDVPGVLVTSAFATFPSKRGTLLIVGVRRGGPYGIFACAPGATRWIFLPASDASYKPFSWHDASSYLRLEASADNGDWNIHLVNRSADTVLGYRRNLAAQTGATITDNQPSSAILCVGGFDTGAVLPLDGDIVEVAHLPTSLTAPQTAKVEALMLAKWGQASIE